jgi:hypothetical protein
MMRMSIASVGVLVVALLAVTANAEAVQLKSDSSWPNTGEQYNHLMCLINTFWVPEA